MSAGVHSDGRARTSTAHCQLPLKGRLGRVGWGQFGIGLSIDLPGLRCSEPVRSALCRGTSPDSAGRRPALL
jgi:hypothetical protein